MAIFSGLNRQTDAKIFVIFNCIKKTGLSLEVLCNPGLLLKTVQIVSARRD